MSDDFPFLPFDTCFSFPDPEKADRGLVCQGGNLSPGMLKSAYMQGLFPWFSDGEPLLWWCPDPRFVLFPDELHIPKRLVRTMKSSSFTYTMDKDFESVISSCSSAKRPEQSGTWIVQPMIDAYCELYHLGVAHSFEVWDGEKIVGGLYGVLVGRIFFGESMFTLVPNASKACFVTFALNFKKCGGALIDSQVYTDNLARFGAKNISRSAFLKYEERFLYEDLEQKLYSCYV